MTAGIARRLLLVSTLATLSGCSTRRALTRADDLLEHDRYSAAARAYQDVLERRPDNVDALLGVARARVLAGEPERALAPARAALDAAVPGARLVLAQALVQTGQATDARALLLEAPTDERDGEFSAILVEACLVAGDSACVADVGSRLLDMERGPDEEAVVAWALARHGKLGEAHELASRAALGAPEDGAVQADAAAVFGLAGDAARARGAAATGRTFTHDHGQAWAVAATRRHAAGDIEGALHMLARCVAVFPDEARYTWDLGRLYLELGDPGRAAPLLAKATTLPPFAEPLSSGQRVVVEDRSHGMLSEDERKSTLDQIFADLVLARRQLGDTSGLADAMEARARAVRDVDVPTWVAISEAWLDAGDAVHAVRAADVALANDSGSTAAHRAACRALGAGGGASTALGHCRLVWERTPGDVTVALLLGAIHEQQGDRRSARAVYATSLHAAPGDVALTAALNRLGAL